MRSTSQRRLITTWLEGSASSELMAEQDSEAPPTEPSSGCVVNSEAPPIEPSSGCVVDNEAPPMVCVDVNEAPPTGGVDVNEAPPTGGVMHSEAPPTEFSSGGMVDGEAPPTGCMDVNEAPPTGGVVHSETPPTEPSSGCVVDSEAPFIEPSSRGVVDSEAPPIDPSPEDVFDYEAPPTESGGGEDYRLDEEALLTKLVEQNRKLEEDARCPTRITSPAVSTSSPTQSHHQSHDHPPGSHDEPRSKDSLHPTPSLESTASRELPVRDVATPTEDTHPPNSSSNSATPPLSATPLPPTTPPPWDVQSRELDSPTEVRSKPASSAYSQGSHVTPVSEGEESEGLGPDASIVLGDGLETRIPYSDVVPEGMNVGGDMNVDVAIPEIPSSEEIPSHVTETLTAADSAQLESQDIVMELPSHAPSGKGRRFRSDTESRGSKGILLPFMNRKRSHTLQEGGVVKEKDDQEDVSEETQWQQWSDILKHWEEIYPKNSKLVKHLTRLGVPEHLRGMAWQLLSDSINTNLKESYPTLITEVSPHEKAIRRDLNRTFPEHSFFKERDGVGQESLFNVLKAYSVHDKEVGYCQGSPFLVGLLLMQMPEEEAFCVLVQLMSKYRMRDLYKPSMADLSLCFYQMEKLIEELYPSLSIHFKAVGFQPSMYASPWFLTLFASVLSLRVVFRVMDILLMEGRDIIFKVGLALLEDSREQLLLMDMEDMIKHFQKDLKTLYSEEPDQLISRALKISLNTKKMKKFGKEFLEKKARKTLEISEMIRLTSENMEVSQKLMVLQQEFDSLREQLIAGQVTRAEQAEEIVLLRNELAGTRKKLAKLESQNVTERDERGATPAVVPEWAETNGHRNPAQEPHIMKVMSVSPQLSMSSEGGALKRSPPRGLGREILSHDLFDIYKDSSTSPQDSPMLIRGLLDRGSLDRRSLDRGSKENLFLEEETPDTNSPALGEHPALGDLVEKKKKKRKKLLGRSKSEKRVKGDYVRVFDDPSEQQVGVSSPLSPGSEAGGKKEAKKKKEKQRHAREHELERELVLSKTMCADYANQVEVRGLDLKQALQREAFLIRELKLTRQQLEAKVCPDAEITSPSPPADTGPNSSHALLSNLRAHWNSSPGVTKKQLH